MENYGLPDRPERIEGGSEPGFSVHTAHLRLEHENTCRDQRIDGDPQIVMAADS